jgi:transposase-like protein
VARYGQAYKDRIVARLLPPESSSVEHVSREVGISVATLERWRADALATGSGAGSPRWTAAARLQAMIVTAAMDEAARSAWCREQGLYLAELDAWKRDAIAGLGEPRRPVLRRPGRTAGGSRSWSESCIARTRHWPKRPPCLCCQKTSSDRRPACGGRNGLRYFEPERSGRRVFGGLTPSKNLVHGLLRTCEW